MGRVKSDKSPERTSAGPIKCGDLELNIAKESAKKPKFAKRWAAVSGGAAEAVAAEKQEAAEAAATTAATAATEPPSATQTRSATPTSTIVR